MFVKLGIMPGLLEDYAIDGGSTVGELFAVAGDKYSDANVAGYDIQVDGEAGTKDTELRDGSTILLTKQLKGNK